MKIILLATLALFSASTLAAPRLCPVNTIESVQCTADAWVALVPFVSLCESHQGSLIVMDPGAGRSAMIYLAEKTETEQKIIYTAVEENTDNLKLQLMKGQTAKVKGQLSYSSLGTTFVMNFSCKVK